MAIFIHHHNKNIPALIHRSLSLTSEKNFFYLLKLCTLTPASMDHQRNGMR